MARPTEEVVLWAAQDVTLPALAGPNKVLPISDLINKGWDMNQKPAADEFNYLLNNYAKWLVYLDEKSGGASPEAPEVDSLPSTTPLRDPDGKGCFKGIKASNTTNANSFNMIDTYNSKTAVSVSIDGNEIGNFVYNGLLASGDGKSGLVCNTAGTHYGNVVGNVTGNADTATSASKWTTARNLIINGFATGSTTLDGSSNKTITLSYGEGFNHQKGVSGYTYLPNGILLQWGVFENVNDTPVTFPIAFPTLCCGVSFFANDTWSNGDGNDQTCKTVSRTNFVPYQEAYTRKFFYFAIGY